MSGKRVCYQIKMLPKYGARTPYVSSVGDVGGGSCEISWLVTSLDTGRGGMVDTTQRSVSRRKSRKKWKWLESESSSSTLVLNKVFPMCSRSPWTMFTYNLVLLSPIIITIYAAGCRISLVYCSEIPHSVLTSLFPNNLELVARLLVRNNVKSQTITIAWTQKENNKLLS